jgi:cellulose synthase/poly-beta-1,6-N-acetylglucosamine synthase-like glycosyltransferase
MLIWVFAVSLVIFSASYAGYFAYVRREAKKPWNLKDDKNYQPFVSVLVPAHDEEDIIEKKLENIALVSYPKQKIEVIVVDDGSEDKTLMKAENFASHHPELRVKIVKQNPRVGKSAALNSALPLVENSIVVVSDADTFWYSDIFEKALPYMADPTVGAITGRGINENTDESWITKAEGTYLNLTTLIRVGESKIHSTIRFEGGFCAYKKDAFRAFDCETGSDDSGTALDIVQHNRRAILLPDVVFSTSFPATFSGKFRTKVRRAVQLIGLWLKCLKLMFHGQLVLPKKIAVPEIMLFIFNPLFFLLMLASAIGMVVVAPLSLISVIILVSVGALLVFARRVFVEVFIDNLVLLYALVSLVFGRRYTAWQKTRV